MASLYNGCLTLGEVPPAWLGTAIRPVPKCAGPATLDETRPIAVGSALPKLYAAALNDRLVSWAERNGKHAPQQAGFRPRLSTTHHLFALRHMVDWHRRGSTPLYVAFVDFRKAYDSVNRHLLWLKLQHLGVQGNFLGALQSLYRGDTAYVQLDGCRSEPFSFGCGVKQGCPLSPTLFSLFFDHIADYLRLPCVKGPLIPGIGPLSSLLYADDVVIFANSAEDLNRLMAKLHSFCSDWDMAVNTVKTQVMLVGGGAYERAEALTHGRRPIFANGRSGRRLQYVKSYKYLGIELHQSLGFRPVMAQRAAAAQRCLGAMRGCCAAKGYWGSLDLQLRLFDVLVTPVAEYGVAAWAPPAALVAATAPPNALEQLHRCYLRRLLGVAPSTAAWPLYEECGRQPWQARWVLEVANLWSRTVAADAPPQLALHRAIMAHNVQLHFEPQDEELVGGAAAAPECDSWTAGFLAALDAAAPGQAAEHAAQLRGMLDIAPATVAANLRERCLELAYGGAGADPRAPACPWRGHAAYATWSRPGGDPVATFRKRSYMCMPELPPAATRSLARFRLGSHRSVPSHAAALRQRTAEAPHAYATPCAACGAQWAATAATPPPEAATPQTAAPADSMHILWECVATAGVRERHTPFLLTVPTQPNLMAGLAGHANQQAAARFILDCLAAL